MKLDKAKLCYDCDEVFFHGHKCPACSSTFYADMTVFVPSLKDDRVELVEAASVKVIKDPWWWRLPIIGKYFRPFDIAF